MITMFAMAALGAQPDGGVVVRLDYSAHLFLPTAAVADVARKDKDLARWLDEATGEWRMLPTELVQPERVERLVGTQCGTAIVAGAPTADLAELEIGSHEDGEAWWVLPTGEPLIEQVRGPRALAPVEGCGFWRSWMVVHTEPVPGSRFYGLLLARRRAVVDATTAHFSDQADADLIRWARTRDRGVHAWAGPWPSEREVWHDLLAAGEVTAILPQGLVGADDLVRAPHPDRGVDEWWTAPEVGALVWPVVDDEAPATALVTD